LRHPKMGQKFRSFALRSSKEILCPNGDNTATASAMTAQSNGGRKGQESKIERNQKLRLKVGDEIAPSDNRNETIQFINSKDGDETQRLNAQIPVPRLIWIARLDHQVGP
jgi:hypothetical protein